MSGCDAVIHFAAESHVDRSIYEPAPVIQTNVTGTFILLEVARKVSVSRFVHVSTDEVYATFPQTCSLTKASPCSRAGPYSASKAASDLLVRSYVRTYKFPRGDHAIFQQLRPLSVSRKICAPHDHQCPQRQGAPRLWRRPTATRLLHVEDNCLGILTVLEKGKIGEVYNIGGRMSKKT